MTVLRTAKLLTLNAAKSLGILEVLRRSEWRKNQLLILAYHGVSQDDEHLWNPELFVSPEGFANRMQALKEYGCQVLSLNDALEKLWAKTLPPCSVVLTFDDGGCDFYRRAFPILRQFNWPATVYLTSYYSGYNRPVFDVMCSYLLWKGQDRILDTTGLMTQPATFQLNDPGVRESVAHKIQVFARESRFSAAQKDELLSTIAERLGVDYQTILTKRILHLLSAEELAELAAEGVDIQLHTHRHYAPKSREYFLAELEENRKAIVQFTKVPHHFSYPHGLYEEHFDEWLGSFEVFSATTCEPGLATNSSDHYKLPRLIDTSSLELVELEGWISGFSKFLPRKRMAVSSHIPPYYY
jgi:peptidoglycan/xylan/chitin deacetylase (PgdA/CDA1 family)